MAAGKTAAEIADQMSVSVYSVGEYVTRIREKLNVLPGRDAALRMGEVSQRAQRAEGPPG